MRINFENIHIEGILVVLPERKEEKTVLRYNAKTDSFTSDFFVYGLKYLLENNKLNRNDIGAIVTASFTPDYLIPQLSFRVHGALELERNILCTDINEENSGYLKGLMDAMLIAERMPDKKVVFLSGNISDKRKNDNVEYYGDDGASVTVLQHKKNDLHHTFLCKSLCKTDDIIKIHSGGFRDLFHENGNKYVCDRTAICDIMEKKLPDTIHNILVDSNFKTEDLDAVFIADLNANVLQSISDNCGIPTNKIIASDSLNSSILNIRNAVECYINRKTYDGFTCCLCDYGAGINYNVAIMEWNDLTFCDIVNSNL